MSAGLNNVLLPVVYWWICDQTLIGSWMGVTKDISVVSSFFSESLKHKFLFHYPVHFDRCCHSSHLKYEHDVTDVTYNCSIINFHNSGINKPNLSYPNLGRSVVIQCCLVKHLQNKICNSMGFQEIVTIISFAAKGIRFYICSDTFQIYFKASR